MERVPVLLLLVFVSWTCCVTGEVTWPITFPWTKQHSRQYVGFPHQMATVNIRMEYPSKAVRGCHLASGTMCYAKDAAAFREKGCKDGEVYYKISAEWLGKVKGKYFEFSVEFAVDIESGDVQLPDKMDSSPQRGRKPFAPLVERNGKKYVVLSFSADPTKPGCFPKLVVQNYDAVDMTENMKEIFATGFEFSETNMVYPPLAIEDNAKMPANPNGEESKVEREETSTEPADNSTFSTTDAPKANPTDTAVSMTTETVLKSGISGRMRWIIGGSVAIAIIVLLGLSLCCGICYVRKKLVEDRQIDAEKSLRSKEVSVAQSVAEPTSTLQSRMESESVLSECSAPKEREKQEVSQGKNSEVKSKKKRGSAKISGSKEVQKTQKSSVSKEKESKSAERTRQSKERTKRSKEVIKKTKEASKVSTSTPSDDQYETFSVLGNIPPPPAP